VQVALHGARRTLDLGVVNGEHFAVMAGVGFDARMIGDADGSLKDRLGRAAYVFTGARNLRARSFDAHVRVDGDRWVKGSVTCVLCANVGKVFGGITLFDGARPDDGRLDIGMVTATGAWQWTRTLSRTVIGRADDSPFVEITQGRRIDVKLHPPVRYELDGGARGATKRLRIEVDPDALTVCVPFPDPTRP
jgi:diacylglycerol kinase family enzyme